MQLKMALQQYDWVPNFTAKKPCLNECITNQEKKKSKQNEN